MIYSVGSTSAVQKSDPVVHIYTFFLPYDLPSWSIPGDWTEFPVLHSRTSLLLHSQWNSWRLLTPNSPSIPLPPISCSATINLFSVSVSLFLFCSWVHWRQVSEESDVLSDGMTGSSASVTTGSHPRDWSRSVGLRREAPSDHLSLVKRCYFLLHYSLKCGTLLVSCCLGAQNTLARLGSKETRTQPPKGHHRAFPGGLASSLGFHPKGHRPCSR